jgi:hypothetical protein
MDETNDALRLKERLQAHARRATLGRVATFGSPLLALVITAIIVAALPEDARALLVCEVMAALAFIGSAAGGLLITGPYDTTIFRATVAVGCGLLGLAAFAAVAGVAALVW